MLPNVDPATRKDCIREFQVHTSFAKARVLESYCHANRCHLGRLGSIPCWTYNGVTLFETDRIEDHVHAAQEAYADNVLKTCAALKHGLTDYGSTPDMTDYDTFKKTFHDTIAKAKSLLEEKQVATVGLFRCKRCKSLDVDTEQKQTRSADEPMTIFCLCTKCGLRFTIR